MSYIRAFITPEQLFAILHDLRRRHEFVTVLRRFETALFDARWELTELTRETARYFNDNGFSEVNLTLTKMPKHQTDWSFVSEAADELIVIEGGRQRGLTLEQVAARVFQKDHSKALPLFRSFRRAIQKTCRRGVVAGGVLYRDVFYHPSVADLDLRESLHASSPSYQPQLQEPAS